MSYDAEKMKAATRLFIEAIGDDPNREGLLETPERCARMWKVLLGGYGESNEKHIKVFTAEAQDMVTVCNVNFYSYCEHHMQPFIGKLSMAYIPNEKVLGVSKLVRMARTHCKKLQIQERLTKQIADDIQNLLNPLGVAVQLKAQHYCMALRGVRSQESVMVTTAVRGLFKDDEKARNEFLETIKGGHEVNGY